MNKVVLLAVMLLLLCGTVFSQDRPLYVTYGNEALPQEGDDDFQQVFYFSVPVSADSIFIRLFDPDAGGKNDLAFGPFNSNTRFSLYGGKGAWSDSWNKGVTLNASDKSRGVLLHSAEYGFIAAVDNIWVPFHGFTPAQGEAVDGIAYFKLVVEGLSGNDANVFDIFVSSSQYRNVPVRKSRLFSYAPTIHFFKQPKVASLRFALPPSAGSLEINDFDLTGAKYFFESAFRPAAPLIPSADGKWNRNTVQLQEREAGRDAALLIGSGGESPNDVTFYLKSGSTPVAIELPAYYQKQNNRPAIVAKVSLLADCYSAVFDAKGSADKDGNQLTYLWKFGDGSTEQGIRVVHKYASQRVYDAELQVTDNSGQVGNASYALYKVPVNRQPAAKIAVLSVAAPGQVVNFDGTGSADPDGSISRYLWQFGDKLTAEGGKVSHAYRRPGKYTVALRVEDNSESPCNFNVANAVIWVNDAPQADAGLDQIAAPGEELSFSAAGSRDRDGKIVNYSWEFGDGKSASGQTVRHAFTAPGLYTVKLSVTDDAGVSNSTVSDFVNVKVNAMPVSVAGQNVLVADGETVSFDGSLSSDSDGKIVSWNWDFGDGSSESGRRVSHIYPKPGKYKVTLTVEDNSGTGNGSAASSLVVTVNAAPVAVGGKNLLITRTEVKFDGSSSYDPDGAITKYYWEFGDGFASTDRSPLHAYRKTGVYYVRLSVTDNTPAENNTTTDEFEIIVNEKPVADAGSDRISSPGQAIQFDAGRSYDPDGEIIRYAWDFGDGNSAEGKSPRHTYVKPGIYTVRLTVYDNTGHPTAVAFDDAVVSVNNVPVAKAGNNAFIAPGDVVTLDGTASYDPDGKLAEYSWLIAGVNRTFSTPRVDIAFDKPGIYPAVLTVRDNSSAKNDVSVDTIFIRVNDAPVAKAGPDVFTCDNRIFFNGGNSADPDGDPLVFTWDFGDNTPPVKGVAVYHLYEKPGTYPVVLTVDDGAGLKNSVNRDALKVIINAPPVANVGPDETVCAGEIVTFNAGASRDPEGSLLRYYWEFGDGSTGEGVNPTKIYKFGGTYEIKLKVEDDSGLPCNVGFDSKVLTVIEAPVAFAGEDVVACANAVIKFDGSKSKDYDGVVNNFNWDFGDGSSGGGMAPTHAYAKPGKYRVVLTITGDPRGDCDNTDTDELMVMVYDAPVAANSFPEMAMVGQEITFDASASSSSAGAITSWQWEFGDGASASGKTVKYTYKKFGRFPVTLTLKTDAANECNNAVLQKFITVNAQPEPAFAARKNVAVNEVVRFDASASKDDDGSIMAYDWNFGDGTAASGVVVDHAFTKYGTYPVTLTVTDNTLLGNNKKSSVVNVVVNAAPVPAFSIPADLCAKMEYTFDASPSTDPAGSIKEYLWDFGDGYTANTARSAHTFREPGTYSVTLFVDDGTGLANAKEKLTRIVRVNNPPVARPGASFSVCPGQEFTLDASRSFDADADSLRCSWSLGRGEVKYGKIIRHRFTDIGNYLVKLTVDDGRGTACSQHTADLIVKVNGAPVARANTDTTIYTGGAHDEMLFDASRSSDPDGDPLTFAWDFGDGTKANGPTLFHRFDKPGKYLVSVTVADDEKTACSSSVARFTVTVLPRPDELIGN